MKGNITKHRFEAGNREEWLALRDSMTDKVGGSALGAIAGHSRYSSFLKEVEFAVGLRQRPDISDKIAVVLGRENEPLCARLFEKASGKTVHNENCIFTNDAYPHLKASIDRKIANERSGLECKTSFGRAMEEFKEGEFPQAYFDQTCCYLAVTQNERWYLAILTGFAFKVFLMTTVKEEEERFAELRARFLYPSAPADEADADYREWKEKWAYLEAVYYVDEETLDGCEAIAAKYVSTVDEINSIMKGREFNTQEEKMAFLQNAIFQVVDPSVVTEIDASSGNIGVLSGAAADSELVLSEGSECEEYLKERVERIDALAAKIGEMEAESAQAEAEMEMRVASLNAETVRFAGRKVTYKPTAGRKTASASAVERYFAALGASVPEGLVSMSVPKKPMTMRISADRPRKGKKVA